MRLRCPILIYCLGLIGMVPASITPIAAQTPAAAQTPDATQTKDVAAQTEEVDPESAPWRQDVAAFLAGMSPARQAAIGRINDGLDQSEWKAFLLLLIGLEPDAQEAVLARLERLSAVQFIAFRNELELMDRALWPEVLEVAGASPDARKAHSVSLIEAQLLPGEKAEITAFLAQQTPRQMAALLQVTDRLSGFGERGLLVTFLARLVPEQQPAMIELIEHMTAAERATFAKELHDNGYENWSILPAFRTMASEFEVLRIMFGFLPCRPIGVAGLERCHLPEGSEAFVAKWRATPIMSRHPDTDAQVSDVPVSDTMASEPAGPPPETAGTAGLPDISQVAGDVVSRFDALLATFSSDIESTDREAVQIITASLSGDGERLRFKAFFLNLTDEERARLLAFIGRSPAEDIADALHQVPPDAWPLLTRFLTQQNPGSTDGILSGYLPCWSDRRDSKMTCQIPEGTREFLAIWPIRAKIRRQVKVKAYGVKAKPSEARWQAQIFKFGKSAGRPAADQASWESGVFGRPLADFEWLQVCGGVYIEPHWILTAAHCTEPPNDDDPPEAFLTSRRVRLGTTDIASGGGSEWRIDGVVRHADADSHHAERGNDIALLHIVGPVAGPISKGQTFVPTPIRRPGSDDSAMISGASVELTGWGVTGIAAKTRQTRSADNKPQVPVQTLQIARLQYWQPDYCNRDPRFSSKGYKVGPGQICAGSLDNQTACYLDSGGPLVRHDADPENRDRARGPVLIGLVSFGIGCGNVRAPSGFVDVRYFEGWIKRAKASYKPGKFVSLR